ncbi:Hypothetical protein AJAP_42975 (plasmid) [Amycolatopsis japonica]|uniref:Uncharacterized protein n=2 Tax=Amycolatopsis japonica TaxID=208439 RepID=A0A075VA11_9PSEU|nr:Hypothetical protein AJAP_42975 [Amycolatopsis japonica]
MTNLLSHQKGHRITEEFLASQCADGVKKVRSVLIELRDRGYVYRSKERDRYPKGTKNAAGKDISGALGPYTWWVTDKPEVIATILAKYAEEQRTANVEAELSAPVDEAGVALDPTAGETPGRDNMPNGEVVPTSENSEGDQGDALPPQAAGSDDQAKQGKTAARDNRPITTGGSGSSLEDQPQKTRGKKNTGGTLPPDPQREQPPTGTADDEATSPNLGARQGGHQQGDHKRAPREVAISPNFEGDDDTVNEFARLLWWTNQKATQTSLVTRAYRALVAATAKDKMQPLVNEHQAQGAGLVEARDAARRALLGAAFEAAAAEAGVQLLITWKSAAPAEPEPVPDLAKVRASRATPAAVDVDLDRAARIAEIRAAAGVPRGRHYDEVLRNAPRAQEGPVARPGASGASLHNGHSERRATG